MFRIENIRDQSSNRHDELIALNNVHRQETSFLTPGAWNELVSGAYSATCVGADGFLIAFDQDAVYDSPNFIWFKRGYTRFVYVDRIVVAGSARGQGLARCFYEQLFQVARRDAHTCVVCEVNIDPPNPESDAFHEHMGFSEVGRAVLENRSKTVRYMCKNL